MNKIRTYLLCFGSFLCTAAIMYGATGTQEKVFFGASDASAMVFLDVEHFAITDDETNYIRIYHVAKPTAPSRILDLSSFLNVSEDSPETDIEAAAKTGDRIYWITSHGRNKNGKIRPSRYRLFYTTIQTAPDPSSASKLVPVGSACSDLVPQILAQPLAARQTLMKTTQIDAALSKKEREKLAPKNQGLNIEGLTWHPGRQSLLIGMRNPLYSSADGTYRRCAIVIELKNPAQVLERQQAAEFGQEMFWNLGGRGIRGMEYSQRHNRFFILAGSVDSETTCALYQWDGDFSHQPELTHTWPKTDSFSPEGLAVRPSDGLLWVVSDDGTLEIPVDSPDQCADGELLANGRCPNKYLNDDSRKTFRIRVMDANDLVVP